MTTTDPTAPEYSEAQDLLYKLLPSPSASPSAPFSVVHEATRLLRQSHECGDLYVYFSFSSSAEMASYFLARALYTQLGLDPTPARELAGQLIEGTE